jgi:hypothetical protein
MDKSIILEKVTNYSLHLKDLSLELQNNYEIVMEAVKMIDIH